MIPLPSDTTISRMHEEASLGLAVPHQPLELEEMMALQGEEAEVEDFSEARATHSVETTACVHFLFSWYLLDYLIILFLFFLLIFLFLFDSFFLFLLFSTKGNSILSPLSFE